jgi:hypothetical protein
LARIFNKLFYQVDPDNISIIYNDIVDSFGFHCFLYLANIADIGYISNIIPIKYFLILSNLACLKKSGHTKFDGMIYFFKKLKYARRYAK